MTISEEGLSAKLANASAELESVEAALEREHSKILEVQ